jgi:hypothetical protein
MIDTSVSEEPTALIFRVEGWRRFNILTVVIMEITVSWHVTPYKTYGPENGSAKFLRSTGNDLP